MVLDLGAGNIVEWTLDGFESKDPKAGRVARGGDWYSDGNGGVRSAHRNIRSPTLPYNSFGFRLARGRLQSGEGGSR